MSLQDEVPLDIPEDTARVGEAILKPDNFYRQLGERFVELAPPASAFEPLYEATGRGAIPPVLLTLVIVFQMLEKAPDRLAAEWVVSRLDWKYALHLPLTYAGFHFTDLYAFRQRLLAHQQEALVLDHLLQRLQLLGVLPRTSRVRTDSTHVLGVVERLSRLEALSEGVRLALGAVTALASEWVEQSVPATLRESYARRFSEYGLSQSQVRARWAQVTHDGWWFLARLDTDGPLWTRHLPEVETLRTLLAQQPTSTPPSAPAAPPPAGEPSAEGELPAAPAAPAGEPPMEGEPPAEPASVAGEPAEPTGMVVTSAERLVSPHEPEVRYGEKRGQGWLGYKLQLTETCEPDQPHLIVDLSPTPRRLAIAPSCR